VFEQLPVFEEEDVRQAAPGESCHVLLDAATLRDAQFTLLASRMSALGRDRRLRRIGVVSATLGEGKTTVALGLARALALEGRRVLLLEAHVARPAIDAALGLPRPEVGLLQYLEAPHSTVTVRRPTLESLWVLSAGEGRPGHVEWTRMGALLAAAQRAFDYIVVDCPPLLPATDEVLRHDLLDGLLFVVRSRYSLRATVRRAAALMRPGTFWGVVFNAHRELRPFRRGPAISSRPGHQPSARRPW
jgi:Mrp family chromosome partitioning ATPase